MDKLHADLEIIDVRDTHEVGRRLVITASMLVAEHMVEVAMHVLVCTNTQHHVADCGINGETIVP